MRKVLILFGIGAAMLCAQDLSQYQGWMKDTRQTTGAIRTAIAAKDDSAVKANADKLAGIYEQVASFWKEKGKDEAVKLADATRDAAKEVGGANGAEAQTAALQKVMATCQPCHSQYRAGNQIKQ